MLQAQPISPQLRRALKWFGNGVASEYREDQFAYFWFVIELVAGLIKSTSPVPDKCPKCRGQLYCEACGVSPLHRPYPKQAIEQLFMKYVSNDPDVLHKRATSARNMLMHGDEVRAIEAALAIDFSALVDHVGALAWIALLNQFGPSLHVNAPTFLETSHYVRMNLSGRAHMKIGFPPNFDNPDPAHFPKVELSMTRRARRDPSDHTDPPSQ